MRVMVLLFQWKNVTVSERVDILEIHLKMFEKKAYLNFNGALSQASKDMSTLQLGGSCPDQAEKKTMLAKSSRVDVAT